MRPREGDTGPWGHWCNHVDTYQFIYNEWPLKVSLCVCVCVCSTAIAIRCKDGVVFGVEKLVLSKLYEEGSNKRIFNIDRHVGMVTTHAPPD